MKQTNATTQESPTNPNKRLKATQEEKLSKIEIKSSEKVYLDRVYDALCDYR